MNRDLGTMDEMKRDVLKEIANIGSGHAATAMAALLGRPVTQSVPSVRLVPLAEMPDILGGAEELTVAGLLRLTGDFSGYLLLFFDFDQAEKIISLVMRKPGRKTGKSGLHRLSAMDKSVLSETVNILGGSYLTAIAEFTGLGVTPSIPYLCIDMVGAVIGVAAAETGKTGDLAVLFESELYSEKDRIIGNLFLIPDGKSCRTLLRALGFAG